MAKQTSQQFLYKRRLGRNVHSFNTHTKKKQDQEANSHRNEQARRIAGTSTSREAYRQYKTTGNHCLFYKRSNCRPTAKGVIVSATNQKGVTSLEA
jgi:hypothetical protein